jgi:hypothetical protein
MNNPVVPGTSNDEEGASTVSSLFDTPEPPTFLFVNESSDAPQYKQGNRHDVRSHVRKHAAKQFGITHKAPRKRAPALPKYVPLTTQSLNSGSSKDLAHDRNCPASVPPTARHEFPARSDSLSEAQTLAEIDESRHDTAPHSADSETPELREPQRDIETYCRACGQPLNRPKLKPRNLSKDGSLVARRPRGKTMLKSNPLQALGAGRIDPFSSLPMDEPNSYSQELMDHGKCSVYYSRA